MPTLAEIRTKVRRLTRSPSTTQLTDAQLDDYINTFVLYDFPEVVLDKTFTFYTIPYVDSYGIMDYTNVNYPLYDFKNKYSSVHNPVYINGNKIELSYSKEQFYNQYPDTYTEASIGTGDGAVTLFEGTLANYPILSRSVTFTSMVGSVPLIVKDVPNETVAGVESLTGSLYSYNDPVNILGIITYNTGVYGFDFPIAPGLGEDVRVSGYCYTPATPNIILYSDNKFTLRPVPDKIYRVDMGVMQRPSSLLAADSLPELSQWWQYIAYGASKKVFEDRMDTESVDAITPEFMQQRSLVLQRMSLNMSEQRTATIYTSRGIDNVGNGRF